MDRLRLVKTCCSRPQAYRIHVFTGKESSSVNVRVKVAIIASKQEKPFVISLDERTSAKERTQLFRPDTEDVFVVDCEQQLGEIGLIEVTNESLSNKQRDWFLDWIAVEDASARRAYVFPCNMWLSSEKGDGRETRILMIHKVVRTSTVKRGQSFMKAAVYLPDSAYKTKACYSLLKDSPNDTDAASVKNLLASVAIERPLHNWARNIKIDNVLCFYPTTIDDVRNIIKWSAAAGLSVRTCGSTHSWTMLYPDSGQVLIDPRHLQPEKGEKLIDYDEKEACVTVLCNATTLQVKNDQLEKKYNFLFNAILSGVTYGGLIGTGCHGVGKNCPAIPDIVEEIHVVNSSGDLCIYDRTDEARLRAVTTSMGLFGFIYKIKFKVLPKELIVKAVNSFEYKVGDTLLNASNLKALVSKNFSTEIYWFPFNQLPLPEGILNLLAPKVMDNLFPKLSVDEMVGKWRAAGDELYVREVNFDENGKPAKKSSSIFPSSPPIIRRQFLFLAPLPIMFRSLSNFST
ncbi:uncharacterized protein [Oscarella lobularis]|uniref:uncharacterized protein isoform X2 n=1 Tax=Oscarella lobularis TaxID=121494 RepID=UPI003313EE6E